MGERQLSGGARQLAGVDEAGRGPLAGPVCAAVVVLASDDAIAGVADSKLLNAARREELAAVIRQRAVDWAVGYAEVEEIDRVNILQATWLAMQRAVASLRVVPDRILVDGNRAPVFAGHESRTQCIVGGDRSEPVISAASILAKVARDAVMLSLDARYPGYGFARHKGYPTAAHIEALGQLGPTPVHRLSFAPVRAALAGRQVA
ncbi:MAG: ribonuclease HII [Gammaproteobacteria bacterium]|nr:ribonuclease HII [Gammaproteobacteria bacterium]